MRERITLSLTTAEARGLLWLVNLGSADMEAMGESDLKSYRIGKRELEAMTRAHNKLGQYVGRREEREKRRKHHKAQLKIVADSIQR